VREVDARDRRAVKVRLTTSGQKFFAEVAQAHEDWVIELFEGLTEEEKNALYQLLGKLKEHVKEVANGASKEKGGWGSKAS
jgi:DNA-binding MarR family transcriptional regulator